MTNSRAITLAFCLTLFPGAIFAASPQKCKANWRLSGGKPAGRLLGILKTGPIPASFTFNVSAESGANTAVPCCTPVIGLPKVDFTPQHYIEQLGFDKEGAYDVWYVRPWNWDRTDPTAQSCTQAFEAMANLAKNNECVFDWDKESSAFAQAVDTSSTTMKNEGGIDAKAYKDSCLKSFDTAKNYVSNVNQSLTSSNATGVGSIEATPGDSATQK